MKTTFYKNKCIITIDENKKIDEFSTVVDLSKVNDALKGLSLLGLEVERIRLNSYVMFDVDSKYYRRFDECFVDKLYRSMYSNPEGYDLIFKNNRLYVVFDGKEIICPIDMHDSGTHSNKELTLVIEYK